MRKLMSAALILALAGCSTAALQQNSAKPTPQSYRLIAVNNVAVPEVITEGPQTGMTVVGGELFLNDDRTFQLRLDLLAQVSSLKPLQYSRIYNGKYDTSTIGVTMAWQDGALTSGAFFGHTLRIYRDGVEYLFLK
jgi:hypothetical protein